MDRRENPSECCTYYHHLHSLLFSCFFLILHGAQMCPRVRFFALPDRGVRRRNRIGTDDAELQLEGLFDQHAFDRLQLSGPMMRVLRQIFFQTADAAFVRIDDILSQRFGRVDHLQAVFLDLGNAVPLHPHLLFFFLGHIRMMQRIFDTILDRTRRKFDTHPSFGRSVSVPLPATTTSSSSTIPDEVLFTAAAVVVTIKR